MTVGERVSLARRAGRSLIPALADPCEDRVLRSLLQNRLLIEADVIRLAAEPRAPREFLSHLAGHSEWGTRRSIRYAVVANPRTPICTAVRALRGLEPDDLRRLTKDDNVAPIVLLGASRVLSESEHPGSSKSAAHDDDPTSAAR